MDETCNQKFTIGAENLKSFEYTFASTCHSTQGDTIRGKTIVCDIESKFVDREWFWVAITRATRIEDVIIWIDGRKDDDYKIQQSIMRKIEFHRRTDASKGHKGDDFVTVDWVMHNFKQIPADVKTADANF